jgi:hypothetical protein
MPRISREQFYASKQNRIAREDVQIQNVYAMRVLPPESRNGLHIPLFITGFLPESSEYGFQLLGRVLTKDMQPLPVKINPDTSGLFDEVRWEHILQKDGNSWKLVHEPGYLLGTTVHAEELSRDAIARLTLQEKQSEPIVDLETYGTVRF